MSLYSWSGNKVLKKDSFLKKSGKTKELLITLLSVLMAPLLYIKVPIIFRALS